MKVYSRLKRLYDAKRITQEELRKAVTLGWITTEEYMGIVG